MLYILLVGIVAGVLARLISPGPNNPSGFILTAVLGIAGAFLATFVGQMIGHYGPEQGAGFITATPPMDASRESPLRSHERDAYFRCVNGGAARQD